MGRMTHFIAGIAHFLNRMTEKFSRVFSFGNEDQLSRPKKQYKRGASIPRYGGVPYGFKRSFLFSRSRLDRSKYNPHQGEGEKERRRNQIAKGMIHVS